MYKSKGFTLIELVVVIIILGILSVTAAPKFLNLSTDARIKTIDQIEVSVKTANDFMYIKSQMPSYTSKSVPNRDDLIDVDLDGNGDYDIRLKWYYLDNTDIEKRVDISDSFIIEYEGITSTYIGYDKDDDGKTKDDLCYFKYIQAESETIKPVYETETTGC